MIGDVPALPGGLSQEQLFELQRLRSHAVDAARRLEQLEEDVRYWKRQVKWRMKRYDKALQEYQGQMSIDDATH